MSIPQILDQVATCRCKLVEITGGEPLLQEDTPDLVRQLLALNYKVLMETNGSHDISRVDRRCVHIVDIKCPASGECHHNDLANLKRIGPEDQLKFVIRDQEDYRFARETLVSVPAGFPTDHVLFSPVAGKLEPAVLAGWILEDHLDVRLHLQLHKFIWPDIDRGV